VSFWDSSALVPLVIDEPASTAMRRLLRAQGVPVVWWTSLVECCSALERRYRAGQLKYAEKGQAEQLLAQLAVAWTEVQPTRSVRDRARRLLLSHDLRAADALQLAAALTWAEDQPSGRAFVCLDERLNLAARQNGFLVLPEEAPTRKPAAAKANPRN
jgi:predicted nucleic acid-binding protein